MRVGFKEAFLQTFVDPFMERFFPHPPDVTGNPWPGCVCNDVRYERGHMESCPCYGLPPDRPLEDEAR